MSLTELLGPVFFQTLEQVLAHVLHPLRQFKLANCLCGRNGIQTGLPADSLANPVSGKRHLEVSALVLRDNSLQW